MIDDQSEAGSWAKALPYCQNITITEHPGDTHPFPLRRETDGEAVNTASPSLQTPAPLSHQADNPGGFEAHPASVVASACGCRKCISSALKVGNGVFHGERNA